MDLTPYVEHLRSALAIAAGSGGDEARALAERLTAPLESAARLTLLDALSAASDEITRELAPGSVDVRLRGLDPEFVVTAPNHAAPLGKAPSPLAGAPVAPPSGTDGDEGGTVRVSFRLPAHLKSRIEEAAGQEGLSVNAWLVRAAAVALAPSGDPAPPTTQTRSHAPTPVPSHGQGFHGWVR